ncbi:MAG: Tim44 domain-containing protein [Candidatus Rokubacteria bacterium]|nr:Tim44 domain-containing protein [Candidatus Rokubacteria bacterium]
MKRRWFMVSIVVALFAVSLWSVDVWARAGGGRSSGSRGSRSYSAPIRPSPSPLSPSRPAAPSSPQPAPQRPGGLFGGLLGGIGGFLLGGMLGSLLFGGMARGLFGGIGLLEILIIGGLIYFALSYMRRRQQAEPVPAMAGGYDGGSVRSRGDQSMASATVEVPAVSDDLERGIRNIRQMDAAFDLAPFAETAAELFFKVQAGWMSRDLGAARDLLTPELYAELQKECDRLRAERRVNRLENIAVRSTEVTEAWQEGGRDYVTVSFLANLLDYTVDEVTGQVVQGSRTEPVKFEEYWTFARPVGPNRWKLSAIQQP